VLSFLPERQRTRLYQRVALAPGGIVEVVGKATLLPENHALFLISLIFQDNILGIDATFEEGIEKSYRKQKSILLEVHSGLYLKMHYFPRFGEKGESVYLLFET
jgi:hypothetical protein